MVREIISSDFDGLMALYTQLHDNPFPEKNGQVLSLWRRILEDDNHHIIVAEKDGEIVSSCVCVIVPNLTHAQRPYALIENVVTDGKHRGCGYASACLEYARGIAKRENCYKLMLLTGSKNEKTLQFYERAGYNRQDKTGFVQWI